MKKYEELTEKEKKEHKKEFNRFIKSFKEVLKSNRDDRCSEKDR